MRLNTLRFGELELEGKDCFRLTEGLLGLESLKSYVLIHTPDTHPLYWLQSSEDPEVALPVINPFLALQEYDPELPESVFEELQIEAPEDAILLAVAVIPEDITKMTANLLAPVLLNARKNTGRQVILESGRWSLRHPIFDAVAAALTGGGDDAGTDA